MVLLFCVYNRWENSRGLSMIDQSQHDLIPLNLEPSRCLILIFALILYAILLKPTESHLRPGSSWEPECRLGNTGRNDAWADTPSYNEAELTMINLALRFWQQSKVRRAEAMLGQLLRGLLTALQRPCHFVLARCLYALGNVCETLGRLDEAERHDRKAQDLLIRQCGASHHRTADIICRVARHDMRRGSFQVALDALLKARSTWDAQSLFFTPELARVGFMISRLYAVRGEELPMEWRLRQAWTSFQNLRPFDTRGTEELDEKDFDGLLVFWCK